MANLDENKKGKEGTNFAKYSGMAFQMLATIGVMAFIGYKIDDYRESAKLIFTAIFGLLGVILSLYQIVRSLNKNS